MTSPLSFVPLLLTLGCGSLGSGTVTSPAPAGSFAANALPPASSPPIASGPAPATANAAPGYRDCGPLACKAFSSSEAAFDYVLREAPRVLAIGEAHAQATEPPIVSATRRFMDQLLPRLAPRASDLVIELWVANGSCGKAEQKVETQQKTVTAPQASSNQSDFMELGFRAKALRIAPRALVPTCEQYERIAGAGDGDVEEMLGMLKTVAQRELEQLLGLRAEGRLLVAYGGALHNDLSPRPGFAEFSFGPELAQLTGNRYVELDLVIPEQIKDTEAWKALPWYAAYARQRSDSEALLLSWAPHAYALFFPPAHD